MNERRVVWYSGWVQGVGFRYTTRAVAQRYKVTGYVKNLPDGRVVVEAEGEPAELDRFFSDVEDRMGEYIRGKEEERGPATGQFDGFTIRF